jgi:hypothetical protein
MDSRTVWRTAVAGSRRRMTPTQFVSRYGMLVIFAILVAGLMVLSPTFRAPANLINVLQQNSIIGIVACGMLLMIVVGGSIFPSARWARFRRAWRRRSSSTCRSPWVPAPGCWPGCWWGS